MSQQVRVAVDAMTSEKGVLQAVLGAQLALQEFADLKVILVGDPTQLEPLVHAQRFGDRLEIVPSRETIGMEDEPGAAFKAKKDASVSVANRLVAEGKADAVMSPGNTGASLTASTLILGRVKGVRRPAIMTLLPSSHGSTALLDSGAVVDCRPEDLLQWGLMGSIYMKEVRGIQQPRVGLLSIGEEDHKGNALTKESLPLLKQTNLNFIGNIEGRDLFNGHCDVAVCDGFVGNVVLKTAEGLAKMVLNGLKESFLKSNFLVKIGGFLSKPAFHSFRKRVSADDAGGAVLLGVNGVSVIAHGAANKIMIKNAIRVAHECVRLGVIGKIKIALENSPEVVA